MPDQPKPKKRGRPRVHPEGYRASGPPPDTTARLGEARRAWLLARFGGYQAGLVRLIDDAMAAEVTAPPLKSRG